MLSGANVKILDIFNFRINGIIRSNSYINFIPMDNDRYIYLNRVFGTNDYANSVTGYIVNSLFVTERVHYSSWSCAQYGVINTEIDKIVVPYLELRINITATTYPVYPQFIIDGFFFELE